MNWKILAEKFERGFKNSDLSQRGMGGVTDSESISLRGMMRKESYHGSMAFFICHKVCEEFAQIKINSVELLNALRDIDFSTINTDDLAKNLAEIKRNVGRMFILFN